MTEKQKEKLIKKFNSELYLCRIENKEFRKELKILILSCNYKRIYNSFTIDKVAKMSNVSESTIKRIENGEIYDIAVLRKYIDTLEYLPNK